MSTILRVYPTKFHEHFHTESHENWYSDVFGHAEQESSLIFLITVISNYISSLRKINRKQTIINKTSFSPTVNNCSCHILISFTFFPNKCEIERH